MYQFPSIEMSTQLLVTPQRHVAWTVTCCLVSDICMYLIIQLSVHVIIIISGADIVIPLR